MQLKLSFQQSLEHRALEAEEAYNDGTHGDIGKIIQELENNNLQEASDPEMEDWNRLLPDPGHTRGRISLYKQALHFYWVMKRLLAKTREQVAEEMIEIAEGIPNGRKEMDNMQCTLLRQDSRLKEVQMLLQKIVIEQCEAKIKLESMVD